MGQLINDVLIPACTCLFALISFLVGSAQEGNKMQAKKQEQIHICSILMESHHVLFWAIQMNITHLYARFDM